MTDDKSRDAFERWWKGSKYMQVVFSSNAQKQVALDGWRAALRDRDEQEHQIEYQVWQDDMPVAMSTDLDDAKHYMMVYGQDGPVQLREVVSYSRDITDDEQEKQA